MLVFSDAEAFGVHRCGEAEGIVSDGTYGTDGTNEVIASGVIGIAGSSDSRYKTALF